MAVKILIAIALIIIVITALALKQPSDFRYERSAVIAAGPSVIFDQVNDLHKWNDWSPWAKLDPATKQTFEGPATGVGSKYSWEGNSKVGAGSMTILESVPGERVKLQLEFFKPMKASNIAEFTFKPEGDQTLVTWSMYGPTRFMGKVFNLFVNCEKMVGGMFEQGLSNLKSLTEAKPAAK